MKRSILLLAAVAVLTSCSLIDSRRGIDYMDEVVDVYNEDVTELPSESRVVPRGRDRHKKVEDFEYEIRWVARVLPVDVGGQTVQANDVVIQGKIAVITYNTAGDPFDGALQVIDLSDPSRPVITAEFGLANSDVNAVLVTKDDIYIAGAADPDSIPDYDAANPDRAFIVRIARADLATLDGATIEAGRVILDGFAATGIAEKDGTLFVSTGALNGELEILDTALAQTIGPFAYGDLRDIESYHGGAIALQGTDESGEATGRVLVFDSAGNLEDNLPIADFGSPEKKATIEVYDKRYAFLGLSEGGFEAIYLKEDPGPEEFMTQLVSFENPTVDWTTETDTNSASYHKDLVFTANGEAGFRVFRVLEELNRDVPPDNFAELVGFVPFDETRQSSGDYWSANHVEFKKDVLVVASGLGGVNFYTLTLVN